MSFNVFGSFIRNKLAPFVVNPQVLRIDLVKGEASAVDLEIKKEVFSFLPCNVVVKSAVCTSLRIRVPYTRLDHEPITVRVSELIVSLAESDEFFARDRKDKNKDKTKSKKAMSSKVKMMLDGISLQVNSIRLRLDLLPIRANIPPPSINLVIEGISCNSTNMAWEQLDDLAHMRTKLPYTQELLLFKLLVISSISLSVFHPSHVIPPHDMGPARVIDRAGVTCQLVSKRAVADWRLCGMHLEVEVSEIHTALKRNELLMCRHMSHDVQAMLNRAAKASRHMERGDAAAVAGVPILDADEVAEEMDAAAAELEVLGNVGAEASSSSDMHSRADNTVSVKLVRFHLELLENTEETTGFALIAHGITVTHQMADSTFGARAGEENKSTTIAELAFVTVKEVNPSDFKLPQHLSMLKPFDAAVTMNVGQPQLRIKIINARSLDVDVHFSPIEACVDAEVLHRFYVLCVGGATWDTAARIKVHQIKELRKKARERGRAAAMKATMSISIQTIRIVFPFYGPVRAKKKQRKIGDADIVMDVMEMRATLQSLTLTAGGEPQRPRQFAPPAFQMVGGEGFPVAAGDYVRPVVSTREARAFQIGLNGFELDLMSTALGSKPRWIVHPVHVKVLVLHNSDDILEAARRQGDAKMPKLEVCVIVSTLEVVLSGIVTRHVRELLRTVMLQMFDDPTMDDEQRQTDKMLKAIAAASAGSQRAFMKEIGPASSNLVLLVRGEGASASFVGSSRHKRRQEALVAIRVADVQLCLEKSADALVLKVGVFGTQFSSGAAGAPVSKVSDLEKGVRLRMEKRVEKQVSESAQLTTLGEKHRATLVLVRVSGLNIGVDVDALKLVKRSVKRSARGKKIPAPEEAPKADPRTDLDNDSDDEPFLKPSRVAGLHLHVELLDSMLRIVGPLPGVLELHTGGGLLLRNRAIPTRLDPRVPRHLGSPTAVTLWSLPARNSTGVVATGCPPRRSQPPAQMDLLWGKGGEGLHSALQRMQENVDQTMSHLRESVANLGAAQERAGGEGDGGGAKRPGKRAFMRSIMSEIERAQEKMQAEIMAMADMRAAVATKAAEDEGDETTPQTGDASWHGDTEDVGSAALRSVVELGGLCALSRRVLTGLLVEEERALNAHNAARGASNTAKNSGSRGEDAWGRCGGGGNGDEWDEVMESLRTPTLGGMLEMFDAFMGGHWLSFERASLQPMPHVDDWSSGSGSDEDEGGGGGGGGKGDSNSRAARNSARLKRGSRRVEEQTDKLQQMIQNTQATLLAALANAEEEEDESVENSVNEGGWGLMKDPHGTVSPMTRFYEEAMAAGGASVGSESTTDSSSIASKKKKPKDQVKKWLGKF